MGVCCYCHAPGPSPGFGPKPPPANTGSPVRSAPPRQAGRARKEKLTSRGYPGICCRCIIGHRHQAHLPLSPRLRQPLRRYRCRLDGPFWPPSVLELVVQATCENYKLRLMCSLVSFCVILGDCCCLLQFFASRRACTTCPGASGAPFRLRGCE